MEPNLLLDRFYFARSTQIYLSTKFGTCGIVPTIITKATNTYSSRGHQTRICCPGVIRAAMSTSSNIVSAISVSQGGEGFDCFLFLMFLLGSRHTGDISTQECFGQYNGMPFT